MQKQIVKHLNMPIHSSVALQAPQGKEFCVA